MLQLISLKALQYALGSGKKDRPIIEIDQSLAQEH
jgi:hypothetical protein